jgi:hypothetical protein
MITLPSNNPQVQALLRSAGVNSRKKKVFIHKSEKVTCSGTYWDGGSRSSYILVKNGQSVPVAGTGAPQFNGGRPETVLDLDENTFAVEVGVFCGKPATPAIYLHPAALEKLNLAA